MRNHSIQLIAAVAALFGSNALGDVTVDHYDRGSYRSTGRFPIGYAVRALNPTLGEDPNALPAIERERNYHTFDLSGLSGMVEAATLRVWVDAFEDQQFFSPYQSSDPFETVNLFDVSTSADVLADPDTDAANSAMVFEDLGSGNSYGALLVNSTDASNYIDVQLSPNAIDDLNAAVGAGFWSVGGALDFDGSYGANVGFISERVLHGDRDPTNDLPAQLVLTGSVVPEPASALLTVLLVGAAGIVRYRVRKLRI